MRSVYKKNEIMDPKIQELRPKNFKIQTSTKMGLKTLGRQKMTK